MPHASATAAPPLLPPQVLREVVGIARRAEQRVERLRARRRTPGVFVLPMTIAPARRTRVDVELVGRRHEIAIERGAERRAQPARRGSDP